jgi:arsenite oxidase small subunit
MSEPRKQTPIGDADACAVDEAAADPATLEKALLSRRQFLFGASASIALLSVPGWMRSPSLGSRVYAQVAEFPRQRIAGLSELTVGESVSFSYPWDHQQSTNEIIKLGQRAAGGVGPDEDVVAFNTFCTHQGGPLAGTFKADVGVAGPCPLHWTTFDLTRHGMVVSGHATLGLPQIVLEAEGDDIFATGVIGLIFGYYDNRIDPAGLGG